MTTKFAQIINYLISVAAFVIAIYFFTRKAKEEPTKKVMFGQTYQALVKYAYVGLGIGISLILLTLFT